ncbi:MAG: hypothetical protein KGP28_03620 [Bdellovibrionales bacterium]|nr:hypothetical protein [Bdellovibrionales bacterium]
MESSPWNPFPKLDRFEWIGLFLFFVGHSLAAHFSFGYNHPDEHYQILEFAAHFAGVNADPSALPWEFRLQIRPWFQPLLHAIPMKLLSLAGLHQAFTLTEVWRFVYASLNLAALWTLWQTFKKRFGIDPKWFLLLGTLWFFPYIHVRTSSENLSGIFLTFAFAGLFSGRRWFLYGSLFGFAFLARYQIALGLFGLGVSLLLIDRKIKPHHLKLLAGFMSVVLLGFLLDRIGYGAWAFTPYRYFKTNIVDGVAATFNPYPWYQYFIWIFEMNPLVSLPLFFGVFLYAKKEKQDPMAWFVLSFFLIHLLITNKEYRFLFPILNLVAMMCIRAYQDSGKLWFDRAYLSVYLLSTLLGFSVSTLHGASLESLWGVHMADRHGSAGEAWLSNRDFISETKKLYYRVDGIKLHLFSQEKELSEQLPHLRPIRVLVDYKFNDENASGVLGLLDRENCKPEAFALPGFIFKLRDQIPLLRRLPYRALYFCPAQAQ